MKNMSYISTRGDKSEYSPSEALIKGIAGDKGLFVPKEFPQGFDLQALERISQMSYKELAFEIMRLFFSDFTDEELKACIAGAYSEERFEDELLAPLVKVGGDYFLELFHGRTLAFKDMALSVLPFLMKTAAKKLGLDKQILILTATSGDTGIAAMEGFSDVDGIGVMVFFPKNGVSKVQERQMTTHGGKNVMAAAVSGNFDDAQTAVKEAFADEAFVKTMEKNGVLLSSANSINIGRLVPQIVYYFYAYFQLLAGNEIKIGDKINVCVPTGNFGNILAAYYAKKMGLPIEKFICASNENKVLCDFFETGVYDAGRPLCVTSSPSMDILVSSNLERLLYHVCRENTSVLMDKLRNTGKYEFDKSLLEKEGFIGYFATEAQCASAIAELFDETGYIMDTHTAVAYHSYNSYRERSGDSAKTVIASTASPFKFAESVLTAIGVKFNSDNALETLAEQLAEELPPRLDGIFDKEIRHDYTCEKHEIKEFINKWHKMIL